MGETILEWLLAVLLVIFDVWAWVGWFKQSPRFPHPRYRSQIGFAALLLATVSMVLFGSFMLYAWSIGFIHKLTLGIAVFMYVGRVAAIVGFFLAFFGKGRTRAAAIVISLVMAAVWWGVMAVGAMF